MLWFPSLIGASVSAWLLVGSLLYDDKMWAAVFAGTFTFCVGLFISALMADDSR